jgi:hypothetical protein
LVSFLSLSHGDSQPAASGRPTFTNLVFLTKWSAEHEIFLCRVVPSYPRVIRSKTDCGYVKARKISKAIAKRAIPLQALTGPKGSRRLTLPDFKTIGT